MNYTLTNSSSVIRSDGAVIPEDSNNSDWVAYQLWLGQGNTPEAAANNSPVSQCAMWQLQAILPSDTWANVQSFILASNNQALIAFASHGSALIPSNSTTLATLANHAGIDVNTLYTLVANAATIVIP